MTDYHSPTYDQEATRIYGPFPEGARLQADQGRIVHRVTALELDMTEFKSRMIGPGYDETEVDNTLDRVTVTLQGYEGLVERTLATLETRSLTKREMTDLIRADIARLNPSLVGVAEPQAEAAEAGTGVREP